MTKSNKDAPIGQTDNTDASAQSLPANAPARSGVKVKRIDRAVPVSPMASAQTRPPSAPGDGTGTAGATGGSLKQQYASAKALFDAANYAGALQIYNTLATGGDNSPQLRLCLGKTLLRLKEHQKAIPILSSLVEQLGKIATTQHPQAAVAQAIVIETVLEIAQAQAALQGPATGLQLLQGLQGLQSDWAGTPLGKRVRELQQRLTAQLPKKNPVAQPLGIGFLDGIDDKGNAHGWAIHQQMPGQSVPVYLFLEGLPAGLVKTSLNRPDVTRAGHKGQNSGYSGRLCLASAVAAVKPGAILTAALDPTGAHPLKGQIALTPADITLIVQSISAAVFEGDLVLAPQSVAQMTQRLETDRILSAKDKAHLMAGVLRQQVLGKQSGEAMRHVLDHRQDKANTSTKIGAAAIEWELISCMVAFDQNDSELIRLKDLANVMSAVYHDKQHGPLTSSEAARILNLLGLLQMHVLFARLRGLTAAQALIADELCRLLSQWTQRLSGHTELAMEFLDMCGPDASALSATYLQQAVKLNNEQGRPIAALCMAIDAIHRPDAGWYVHHQAAVIFSLLLKRHGDCLIKFAQPLVRLLCQARDANPEQDLSIKEARQLLRAAYDTAMDTSARQAALGGVQTALDARTRALNLLAALTIELACGPQDTARGPDQIPGHRSPAQRVLLMGSRQLFQCFYYRIQQKMDQLDALGIEYDYVDMSELGSTPWQEKLQRCAVLMACRIPATLDVLEVFACARSLRIPIVYDIDDLIFDATVFPPPLDSYAGTIDTDLHRHLSMDNPYFAVALGQADHCLSSTTPLAEQIKRFVPASTAVTVLPNLLGHEVFAIANAHQQKRVDADRLIVFYGSATKAHKQVFQDTVMPALLQLLAKHEHVDLHLVGYFDGLPDEALVSGRIKLLHPTADYMAYLRLLSQADISIAPLESSVVTDAKSEIKWLEAAVYGVPSVVSPTATYQDVLHPDDDVLFASTGEQWLAQLDRLVSQAPLREQLGQAAKALALRNYQPQRGQDIMRGLLAQWAPVTKQKKPPQKKRKKRVLLVNVYYAPQSIGGATRVVETQARGLLQYHADEFEVEVLTTHCNPDPDRPYGIDQWYSGDIRVTRLHVPPTDWVKTDDAKIGAFCQTFFDEGQFDLIHLHAVQVLTASVADAAQACAIPYVITLHDAWWLSPYLFLVDEQGGAVNPRDLLSGGTPTATEKTQRATRHHRLHQIMGKSAALLAVSHSFADVYRQAGVSAVQTHENISEVFEALPRMQDGDHRTVLGFVGGMSRHKGYHLLQEALETGHYPEFRCVVVDHGMEPGEASYTSQWGQTEIEFIPKIKQNAVANLYSRLDVLIAPSIWPESFGLVTREAAHAGLWVIASDRGAIGDCVQEGINGNIIAVDDCTGLMRALDALKPGRARRASDAPVATALAPAPAQMETYVEKLSAVYQRAIDHNPQQSTSTSAIRASTGHPKPNTRRKH